MMGKEYIALQTWVLGLLESGKSRVYISPAIKSLTQFTRRSYTYDISDDGTITAEGSYTDNINGPELALGPLDREVARAWNSLGYTKLTFDVNIKKSAGESVLFEMRSTASSAHTKYYKIEDTAGKGITVHAEVPISSITTALYLYFIGPGTVTVSNWFISRGE